MSKGYRDGAFALGLVTGIGLALNLILWLSYLAQDKVTPQSPDGQSGQNNGDTAFWWWRWTGDYVSSSDTLAQWIMASVTIVATFVLLLTLRSANKTNAAAVMATNAALEANEIMRQEQRPWVTIVRGIECEVNDRGHLLNLSWNYDLSNKGKAPAYDVHLEWLPVKRNHYQKIGVECAQYAQHCIGKRRRGHTQIIFPGETAEFPKYTWSGRCRYEYIQEARPGSDDQVVIVFICVSYRLAVNSNNFGAEVIAVGFEESKRWLRPFSTRMLEYSNARYIQ